jgi:hypothetical protein
VEGARRGSTRASVRSKGRWISSVRQAQNFESDQRLIHVRLAAVLLFAACTFAFGSAEALATSPANGARATAPIPDPKPPPKPDPKPPPPPPAPVPLPPPPPPPPPAPKARVKPPKKAVAPTPPPRPPAARPKAVPHKAPASRRIKRPVAKQVKPRPKAQPTPKKPRHVQRRKAQVRKAIRSAPAAPVRETLGANAYPAPAFTRRDPSLSRALPVFVPLIGLGLLLLAGASALSARRIPLPARAKPLYARRVDLAAFGFGAIALALLWLNLTVVF